MPILTAKDLSKEYGTNSILEGVSFHVEKNEKIGIVGVNGAGKTTLLDMITGETAPDGGEVYRSPSVSIGYLKQKDDFDDASTILEETKKIYADLLEMEKELKALPAQIAESAEAESSVSENEHDAGHEKLLARYGDLQDEFRMKGGYSYKSEMKGILSSMAFPESRYDQKIGSMSGGERTRLALACLLMRKPDLLILDEPTNHLDIGMLKWLEQFLKSYPKAVMIVSHDRYFLDQIADRIFEIESKRLTAYNGNYTAYAEKKRKKREADLRAYDKQQEEIKRQEEIIRKFKERGTEHLAKRAASREKKLEHMDVIERPEVRRDRLYVSFHQDHKSGNDVIYAEDLTKSYEPGKPVFEGVDLDIKSGERICVVGANGIGKTTLLKILSGETEKTGGYLRYGTNVDIAYYDQRQELLDDDKTVMDEVHDAFRLYKDSEIRGLLGRFMFKGESVFSLVGDLSGGERARLALLKLMMKGANTLLLDEPTNHLDIESKEVFEEALLGFDGTMIAVSHDRYFLNRIATKIYELGKDGITKYEGGYDYYEEKRNEVVSAKKYVESLKDTDEGSGGGAGSKTAGGKNAGPGGAGSNAVAAGSGSGSKTTGGKADGAGSGDTCLTGAAEVDAGAAGHDEGAGAENLTAAEWRKRKKEEDAKARREKRRAEKLEKEIEELEKRIEELQQEMCEPEVLSDHKKLGKLDEELRACQEKLDLDYEEWTD